MADDPLNLTTHDDPRLVVVQQIWVYLEMHKRERVSGGAEAADLVLQEASALYDKTIAKYTHIPLYLRRRLDSLKRELDSLLPH